MSNYRKGTTIELSPEEIMAYSSWASGVPISQITKASGKHRATIHRWIKKVRDHFAANGFDINEYRQPLHGLYALWLRAVMVNLQACDSTFAIAHGKGMGYYQEKNTLAVEDTAGRSTSDLIEEFNGITRTNAISEPEGDGDTQRTQVPN